MKDYTKRIQNLKSRRSDSLLKKSILSDSFTKTSYSESVKYVLESMKPIDSIYNENTYDAARRVQKQIYENIFCNNQKLDFELQGSVTTNTNIRLYSDIDLLVLPTHFETLEHPQVPLSPYAGDPIQDLKKLRTEIKAHLQKCFPTCSIDDTGNKALKIEGGSLNRKIDVISSNWYNTNEYASTGNKIYRGVYILDLKRGRIKNLPFMHNYKIENKDLKCSGNLKRLIRFLKTLKYDSDGKINISSYDITALAYNIDERELNVGYQSILLLLDKCSRYFSELLSYERIRNILTVPNGTRKIFDADGTNVDELVKLKSELDGVLFDIKEAFTPALFERTSINY